MVVLNRSHHQHRLHDVVVQLEKRHHTIEQVVNAETIRADDLRSNTIGWKMCVCEKDVVPCLVLSSSGDTSG